MAELVALRIFPWLPWEMGKNNNYTELLYMWARQMNAVLEALPASDERAPLHIDGAGDLTDIWFQMFPEARSQVKAHVRSGQIRLGPWYTPPLLPFVSDESLVRNLLLGKSRSIALGGDPRVCILPPSPFYSSQLPQILRGFGLRAACVPSTHFDARHWHSMDGSAILLVHMPSVTHLSEAASLAGQVPCLFFDGPFTSAPSLDMVPAVLAEESLPCADNVAPTWGEISTADYEEIDGPSQTPGRCALCPDLNLICWQAAAALERWAEPWATAAWLFGKAYPGRFLERAWISLLQNQRGNTGTESALCRHMRVQAESSKDLAELITRTHLAAVVETPGEKPDTTRSTADDESVSLWVVNPLNWARSEVVTARIELNTRCSSLCLSSDTGQSVPYQLHRVESSSKPGLRQFTISFPTPELPPWGFRRLEAVASATRPYFMGESLAAGNMLENGLLRVGVKANGALRIEDKRSGLSFDNCNVFEAGGDPGALPPHEASTHDRIVTTYATPAQVSIIENGVFSATIQVQHNFDFSPDEPRSFSDKHFTGEITSFITLRRDLPRVDIHTQVACGSPAHRLRVLFSANIADGRYRVAQPFDVVERKHGRCPGTPSHMLTGGFIDVSGQNRGLMVVGRGIYEYEVKPTPAGTIAMTLMKSAAPVREFDYALIPHTGDWRKAFRTAWEFCATPRSFSSHELGDHEGGLSSFSIAGLEPAPLLVTAIKRSEDGQAVIVRAYNPTDETVEGRLTTGWPVASAHLANLDESLLRPLSCHDSGHITVRLDPHSIITLRLEPRHQTHLPDPDRSW
ncbi:MAG: glycosyl hydrolase-related protein [Limnochordia bacterium]